MEGGLITPPALIGTGLLMGVTSADARRFMGLPPIYYRADHAPGRQPLSGAG